MSDGDAHNGSSPSPHVLSTRHSVRAYDAYHGSTATRGWCDNGPSFNIVSSSPLLELSVTAPLSMKHSYVSHVLFELIHVPTPPAYATQSK